MRLIVGGAIAFALTLAAAPPTLWWLRRLQMVDLPTARSAHHQATPRGGGVAPALACTIAWVAVGPVGPVRTGLCFVALGMASIGLLEDVRSFAPRWRLLAQACVAAASLTWLASNLSGPGVWEATFGVGTALWLVAYVNAFNFMDGINGISVAQVVTAGAAWTIVGQSQHVPGLARAGLVVALAAAAFAPFNIPRASMFLGDVGSYFFGAWLAAVVVLGLRSNIAPEAIVAPLLLYGADTLTTLAGRIRRHEAIYEPHNHHAYQRYVQLGWSHLRTSTTVATVIAASSAFGALSLTESATARAVGDTLAVFVVVGFVASPALMAHRRLAAMPR